MNRKQCAIILNGKDVVKVANLKRKYNKLINNPDIKILEECDEHELEDRYLHWRKSINNETSDSSEQVEKPLKYHWRNKITGWTRHSINPELGKDANPDEWEPYD